MTTSTLFARAVAACALVLTSLLAAVADYPAPKEGVWIARDFKFSTGEVMPELRLGYTTIGAPTASRCWCCMARRSRAPAS